MTNDDYLYIGILIGFFISCFLFLACIEAIIIKIVNDIRLKRELTKLAVDMKDIWK